MPERAASWLRPARELTASEPDRWVLTGAPAGCAQLVRRLAWSTRWRPERTLGFASVARPALLALAGIDQVEGMTGSTADARTWAVRDRRLGLGRAT